jgi:hypothetical protein
LRAPHERPVVKPFAAAALLAFTAAQAQKTVTGRHGGTASSTVTQTGKTVNGSATATKADTSLAAVAPVLGPSAAYILSA